MVALDKVKFISATVLTAILAIGLVAYPAYAASPHFFKTPTITANPNDSLSATFKAAGLGNVVTDVFLTSSGGTAAIQCTDTSGNTSQETIDPIQGQVTAVQPRIGQISATVPIGPPSNIECSDPNSTFQIVSITYDNVVLHLQQNGIDILTFNFGTVTT